MLAQFHIMLVVMNSMLSHAMLGLAIMLRHDVCHAVPCHAMLGHAVMLWCDEYHAVP
jgi:hypothetical protein